MKFSVSVTFFMGRDGRTDTRTHGIWTDRLFSENIILDLQIKFSKKPCSVKPVVTGVLSKKPNLVQCYKNP